MKRAVSILTFILSLVCFLPEGIFYAATTTVSGNIVSPDASPVIWTPEESPYKLSGKEVFLNAGQTLILMPGTQVQIPDSTTFIINGRIDSRGTDLQPVVITTATKNKQGGFMNINNRSNSFQTTYFERITTTINSNENTFIECTFQNSSHANPTLTIGGTQNTFSKSLFLNNTKNGIAISGDNNQITDSSFEGNDYGLEIRGKNNLVYNTNFINNRLFGTKLLSNDTWLAQDNTIEMCFIKNNANGILIENTVTNGEERKSSGNTIQYCIISGNTSTARDGKGIGLYSNATGENSSADITDLIIRYNNIMGNDQGLYATSETDGEGTFYFENYDISNNNFLRQIKHNINFDLEDIGVTLNARNNAWGFDTEYEVSTMIAGRVDYSDFYKFEIAAQNVDALPSGIYLGHTEIKAMPTFLVGDIFYKIGDQGEYLLYDVENPIIIEHSTSLTFKLVADEQESAEKTFNYRVIELIPSVEPGEVDGKFKLDFSLTAPLSEDFFLVYYTFDPDVAPYGKGLRYDRSIDVYKSCTVKAVIARGTQVGSEYYFEYQMPEPKVIINNEGGEGIEGVQTITLALDPPDPLAQYAIYYALTSMTLEEDGTLDLNKAMSARESKAQKYSKAFSVHKDMVLKIVVSWEPTKDRFGEEYVYFFGFEEPLVIPNKPAQEYNEPFELTFTSSTPGYDIYFTTNSDDPRVKGTLYRTPVPLYKTTLVRAVVGYGGDKFGEVVDLDYVFDVPELECDLPEGSYDEIKYATLSSNEGYPIYYTTDGTTPSNKSKLYEEPVPIYKDMTLKAIVTYGGETFDTFSAQYQIKTPNITATPDADTYYEELQYVSLICDMEGMDLYYTISPTDSISTKGIKYTEPIKAYKDMTIRVIYAFGNDKSFCPDEFTFFYDIKEPNFTVDIEPDDDSVIYTGVQHITVTPSHPDYDIFYVTQPDGNPVTGGTRYTAPIQVYKYTTLRVCVGVGDDRYNERAIIYNVAMPTITLKEEKGVYGREKIITLSTDEGYSIYYATDNETNLTNGGMLYKRPFTLIKNTVIRAVVTMGSERLGDVQRWDIAVSMPDVEISPPPGSYDREQFVKLYCESYDIEYAIDTGGTNLTYIKYTALINMYKDTRMYVRLSKGGEYLDEIILCEYKIKQPQIIANPPPGIYEGMSQIDITLRSDGFDVYYSTDLNLEKSRWSPDTANISIYKTTTIWAYVARNTDRFGDIIEFKYEMVEPEVTLSHPPGEYIGAIRLAMEATGYSVFYTLDGSDPYGSKAVEADAKSGGVFLYKDTTVRVVLARKSGKTVDKFGAVRDFLYSIKPMPIELSHQPDEYQGEIKLKMTTSADFTIYYTIDGSDPQTNSKAIQYKTEIVVYKDMVIRASLAYGKEKFGVAESFEYIIRLPAISATPSDTQGMFREPQKVSLSHPGDYSIFYTIGAESDPLTDSKAVQFNIDKPIALYKSMVVRAVLGKKTGSGTDRFGDVTQFNFDVMEPDIIADPDGSGGNTTSVEVSLSIANSAFSGFSIYYTEDGSDPQTSKTAKKYGTKKLKFIKDTTLKACVANGTDKYGGTNIFTYIMMVPEISFDETQTIASFDKLIKMSAKYPNGDPNPYKLFYTLDGTNPLTSDSIMQYDDKKGIPVWKSTKVRACVGESKTKVFGKVFNWDVEVKQSIVITPEIKGGYYVSPQTLSFSMKYTDIVGAPSYLYYYYTTDGSDPRDSKSKRTKLLTTKNFTVYRTTTVRIAAASDLLVGDPITLVYEIPVLLPVPNIAPGMYVSDGFNITFDSTIKTDKESDYQIKVLDSSLNPDDPKVTAKESNYKNYSRGTPIRLNPGINKIWVIVKGLDKATSGYCQFVYNLISAPPPGTLPQTGMLLSSMSLIKDGEYKNFVFEKGETSCNVTIKNDGVARSATLVCILYDGAGRYVNSFVSDELQLGSMIQTTVSVNVIAPYDDAFKIKVICVDEIAQMNPLANTLEIGFY